MGEDQSSLASVFSIYCRHYADAIVELLFVDKPLSVERERVSKNLKTVSTYFERIKEQRNVKSDDYKPFFEPSGARATEAFEFVGMLSYIGILVEPEVTDERRRNAAEYWKVASETRQQLELLQNFKTADRFKGPPVEAWFKLRDAMLDVLCEAMPPQIDGWSRRGEDGESVILNCHATDSSLNEVTRKPEKNLAEASGDDQTRWSAGDIELSAGGVTFTITEPDSTFAKRLPVPEMGDEVDDPVRVDAVDSITGKSTMGKSSMPTTG